MNRIFLLLSTLSPMCTLMQNQPIPPPAKPSRKPLPPINSPKHQTRNKTLKELTATLERIEEQFRLAPILSILEFCIFLGFIIFIFKVE